MQYLRSPRIKKILKQNTAEFAKRHSLIDLNGEKIWSVLNGPIAGNAAIYLTSKNIKIKFLVSKNEKFITCDCPVVNLGLSRDKTDKFYYPFSPQIALIISTDSEDSGIIEINDEEAEIFNNLIKDNTERIIVLKYSAST